MFYFQASVKCVVHVLLVSVSIDRMCLSTRLMASPLLSCLLGLQLYSGGYGHFTQYWSSHSFHSLLYLSFDSDDLLRLIDNYDILYYYLLRWTFYLFDWSQQPEWRTQQSLLLLLLVFSPLFKPIWFSLRTPFLCNAYLELLTIEKGIWLRVTRT